MTRRRQDYGCQDGGGGPALALAPPTGRVFAMGAAAVPYSTAVPPQGHDGQCNQVYNAPNFALTAQNFNAGVTSGSFLASCAYDQPNGLIWMMGDTDCTNFCTAYDIVANSYLTTVTNLPGASGNECFAAVLGGKVYIFGGGNSSAVVQNAVLSYPANRSAGAYTTLGVTLPHAAADNFGCTVGSTIYTGGGTIDIVSTNPTTCFDDWLSFDGTNFTALASISDGLGHAHKVAQAACAPLNGFIYVMGGCIDGTGNTKGTKGVFRYSIAGNSWTQLNDLPVAMSAGRAAVVGGQLIVAGGWDANGFAGSAPGDPENGVAAALYYNPANDNWTQFANLLYPCPYSILVAA